MFNYILGLTTLLIAGCAAFFSVRGIALLFAANFWSVAIMASSLELAKLVSASYLYRCWKTTNKILRNYMLGSVILLMVITSLGIFGFLSDAFQRNFSQYSLNLLKINSSKSKQSFVISQLEFNKNKLKDLIDLQKTYQISLDTVIKQDVSSTKTIDGGLFSSSKIERITDQKLLDSKNKIAESSQQNISNLFSQISTVTSDLQNLEKENLKNSQEIIELESNNTKGEIGTFKFVAEAFNLKIETAVRIFIIIIIVVFDPLAVCLVIAYNSLTSKTVAKEIPNKIIEEKKNDSLIEKTKIIYRDFKRGTKSPHNQDLADPNIN